MMGLPPETRSCVYYLDAIANAEVGHVGFTLRLFDDLERGGFHGWFLFSPAVPFGPRLNFCSCRHFAMAW